MADRVIPVVSSIEDVYPVDAISSQRERWNNLLSAFQKQYGRKANFVSRSPGRVNIIGEVRLRLIGDSIPCVKAMKSLS